MKQSLAERLDIRSLVFRYLGASAAFGLALASAGALHATEADYWDEVADGVKLSASIYVCSIEVPPAACDADKANGALLIHPARLAIPCGVQSAAVLAGTGLRAGPGQYVKVACAPTSRN